MYMHTCTCIYHVHDNTPPHHKHTSDIDTVSPSFVCKAYHLMCRSALNPPTTEGMVVRAGVSRLASPECSGTAIALVDLP